MERLIIRVTLDNAKLQDLVNITEQIEAAMEDYPEAEIEVTRVKVPDTRRG